MQTVLILSRGMRLAEYFRKMAQELTQRGQRVVVLFNINPRNQETEFWATPPAGVTAVDFTQEVARHFPAGTRPDKAELARIEAETRVTLYRSTSNYQLYRRLFKTYFKRWPKDSFYEIEDEMAREYAGAYRVLTELMQRYQVDVLFYETIDLITTWMALAVGFNAGKFAFGYDFVPGFSDPRIQLSFGKNRTNLILRYLYDHPDQIAESSWAAADQLLESIQQKQFSHPWYTNQYKKRSDVRLDHDPLEVLRRAFRTRTLKDPRGAMRSYTNRVWLDRHSINQSPEQPFVSFFFQYQPEATLCAYAPRWINQDAIVEQMAIFAPGGMKVVIKENPMGYGSRGESYFGPLLEIPNVVLCHTSVNSHELAAKSEAVVAIVGSIGLECILLGKRAAVLGRPYYAFYPGIRTLNAPEEIYTALKDPTWNPAALTTERRNFAAAYIESVNTYGPTAPGKVLPLPELGGKLLADALLKQLAFVERYHLTPTEFDSGLEE